MNVKVNRITDAPLLLIEEYLMRRAVSCRHQGNADGYRRFVNTYARVRNIRKEGAK